MLHEVHRFDAGSLLASRPWPARQIIGVNEAVLADIIGGTPVTVAT